MGDLGALQQVMFASVNEAGCARYGRGVMTCHCKRANPLLLSDEIDADDLFTGNGESEYSPRLSTLSPGKPLQPC